MCTPQRIKIRLRLNNGFCTSAFHCLPVTQACCVILGLQTSTDVATHCWVVAVFSNVLRSHPIKTRCCAAVMRTFGFSENHVYEIFLSLSISVTLVEVKTHCMSQSLSDRVFKSRCLYHQEAWIAAGSPYLPAAATAAAYSHQIPPESLEDHSGGGGARKSAGHYCRPCPHAVGSHV